MKINSYLHKSRHGVYYFRLTSKNQGKQRSRKVSLQTKEIATAKVRAISLMSSIGMDNDTMTRFKKFEFGFSQGSFSIKTDPSIPDDTEKLGRFLVEHQEILKNIVATTNSNPQPIQQHNNSNAQYSSEFSKVMEKYETRKSKELAKKSIYQYLQAIKKFLGWAETREGLKPLLMYQVDKKLIAQYVIYLQANNHKNQNIVDKHLAPLNSFFDFAISVGEYADIPAPSRNHRLKATKEEIAELIERMPYDNEDLKQIFNYNLLVKNGNPDFYWLPIIALYTGARISEIAQLTIIDIFKSGDIYVMNITDENGGSVKTTASKRKIPIHPILIKLGFIEYVSDIKKYGHLIFPNLIPDPYGSYGKEPSRRFAKYMDDIGITDPSKVFHSFRTTANNHLKQSGITTEERNDMVGHETEGTNNKHYTQQFSPEYLYDKVIPKLNFEVDFSKFVYKKDMFHNFIAKRLRNLKEREKRLKIEEVKKNL